MRWAAGSFLLMYVCAANAEQAVITIDGEFDDWADIAPAYVDALGDSTAGSGFDFGRLWLADDDEYLYLRHETTVDVDPSGNTNFTILAIDTDNNPNTGSTQYGMGVELLWRFGSRFGELYDAIGTPQFIEHPDIGLVGMPTMDDNDFEYAIRRDVLQADTIRLALVTSNSHDQLPESNEVLEYTFDMGGPVLPPEPIPLINPLPQGTQRLMSFNVLRDTPWSFYGDALGRLIAAAKADILCFQEIYTHSAADTAMWVASWHPNNPPGGWHAVDVGDCVTVSRWPIVAWWPVGSELATSIQITAGDETHYLLVINAHLSCCENDSARQSQVDQILSFIRTERDNPNQLLITPETPIVITGDLNLVGDPQQLESLLTGNIVDEGTYGADIAMDNDGSDAEFVYTRHPHTRFTYSWRDDGSDFWPGRLDYLISTDSSYSAFHAFGLKTRTMPADVLAAAGLQADDSTRSDHIPQVADFGFSGGRGDLNQDGVVNAFDIDNFVAALLDPAAFTAANPLIPLAAADMDGNGVINAFDIDPFIHCVLGNCD